MKWKTGGGGGGSAGKGEEGCGRGRGEPPASSNVIKPSRHNTVINC